MRGRREHATTEIGQTDERRIVRAIADTESEQECPTATDARIRQRLAEKDDCRATSEAGDRHYYRSPTAQTDERASGPESRQAMNGTDDERCYRTPHEQTSEPGCQRAMMRTDDDHDYHPIDSERAGEPQDDQATRKVDGEPYDQLLLHAITQSESEQERHTEEARQIDDQANGPENGQAMDETGDERCYHSPLQSTTEARNEQKRPVTASTLANERASWQADSPARSESHSTKSVREQPMTTTTQTEERASGTAGERAATGTGERCDYQRPPLATIEARGRREKPAADTESRRAGSGLDGERCYHVPSRTVEQAKHEQEQAGTAAARDK